MNRHVCCRLNVVWLVLSPYNKQINRTKFYSTEFYIYARLPIRSLTYETDQYFHDLQFSEKLLSTSRIHVPLIVQSYQYFPCDTGAALSEVMGANPVQAWIFFRPYFHYCSSSFPYCRKIAFIFTSLSAVQIYDFHISTVVYSPLHRFIWLVSSVGRALQRYRRGHGFKSSTDLNFF